MNTEPTMLSPQMERMAKRLAVRFGMDWTQKGAHLSLAMAGRPERWLLINLDGERFSVTGCLVERDDTLVPEVAMVFTMHDVGWEPIELLYSHEVFTTYVQAMQAAGRPVSDAEGNLHFDTFTEYWAQLLEAQGWAEHGHPLPEQESYGRMAGCQSTNHTDCYGELWQCAACGKTVCYAEGTDNHPELCDDCWAARFAPADDMDTPGAPFTKHGPLVLVCNCPEQCGTVLKLTHDGFLVLEEADGLLISFMLPAELDTGIRTLMLAYLQTQKNQAVSDREADELHPADAVMLWQ
jgi:hypothetical protein